MTPQGSTAVSLDDLLKAAIRLYIEYDAINYRQPLTQADRESLLAAHADLADKASDRAANARIVELRHAAYDNSVNYGALKPRIDTRDGSAWWLDLEGCLSPAFNRSDLRGLRQQARAGLSRVVMTREHDLADPTPLSDLVALVKTAQFVSIDLGWDGLKLNRRLKLQRQPLAEAHTTALTSLILLLATATVQQQDHLFPLGFAMAACILVKA